MRTVLCITGVLICLLARTVAHGQVHIDDIQLSVPAPGGPIVTSGGEWSGTYAGRVFQDVFTSNAAASPGFDSPGGTFQAGSQIRFDFARELLYWNGSALAVPAASMTLNYASERFATITGNDVAGAEGFNISAVPSNGSFHQHLNYVVSSGAAAGLYGLVLTLGPQGGTAGFATSESFLVTFMQGSLDTPSYDAGMDALVGAAFAPVPEPSGIALGLAAAAALAAAARRRRRGIAPQAPVLRPPAGC